MSITNLINKIRWTFALYICVMHSYNWFGQFFTFFGLFIYNNQPNATYASKLSSIWQLCLVCLSSFFFDLFSDSWSTGPNRLYIVGLRSWHSLNSLAKTLLCGPFPIYTSWFNSSSRESWMNPKMLLHEDFFILFNFFKLSLLQHKISLKTQYLA